MELCKQNAERPDTPSDSGAGERLPSGIPVGSNPVQSDRGMADSQSAVTQRFQHGSGAAGDRFGGCGPKGSEAAPELDISGLPRTVRCERGAQDLKSAVSFARESFVTCFEEAKPLLEAHWQEIARNKDIIPLVPNEAAYLKSEDLGILRIYTGRRDGDLVAYACYFVTAGLHYHTTLWGTCDIFWIHPSARVPRLADRLFDFVESQLRSDGVLMMHTRTKIAHPAAGRILERRGHVPIEINYAKLLKEV